MELTLMIIQILTDGTVRSTNLPFQSESIGTAHPSRPIQTPKPTQSQHHRPFQQSIEP